MANISIGELSLTISELVDLDPEQQNTIESEITRAISAKDIVGGGMYPPKPPGTPTPVPPPPGPVPDDGPADLPPPSPPRYIIQCSNFRW